MPKGVYKHYVGVEAPHYGKIHSNDAKHKIGLANKGKLPWNTGKQWSEDIRKKMSLSHLGEVFTKDRIRKILSRRTPNSFEDRFISMIEQNSLPFRFVGDGSVMVGKKNPDFVHNTKRIAIDVYYTYFKMLGDRDIDMWKLKREKYFTDRGWNLLFFDESQINSFLPVLKELV